MARWPSFLPRRRTHLGSEADRATFRTLHTASLASPALREGLTEHSAERSVRHLRALLGTAAAGLADTSAVLAGMGWTPDPPTATGAARERWESLAALVGLAAEVAAASPGAGMSELCAELEAV